MKASFTRVLAVVAVSSFVMASSSFAKQTHMDAALGYLEQAKSQLQEANRDKAGWRVEAIKQIDAAIASVQRGKEAAH
ncbi:hypothetical protein BH09VER1_BH09VER1_37880 [soil metagenome]